MTDAKPTSPQNTNNNISNNITNNTSIRAREAVKKTFLNWRTDLFLLLASALSFGQYLNRSINQDQISGIGGAIAYLKEGSAERKISGTSVFNKISPKSDLYNLDAIWVGRGESAGIILDGSTPINLSEKTLLILKRPFKQIAGQASGIRGIKLIKGKIETQKGNSITPEIEESTPRTLEPIKSNYAGSVISTYPKDNSTIYERAETNIPILFEWPNSVTGYIDIENRDTGHHNFTEVYNKKTFATQLEKPGNYIWQIVDAERKPILGPFFFILKHLDKESAVELLKNGPKNTTEVHW